MDGLKHRKQLPRSRFQLPKLPPWRLKLVQYFAEAAVAPAEALAASAKALDLLDERRVAFAETPAAFAKVFATSAEAAASRHPV